MICYGLFWSGQLDKKKNYPRQFTLDPRQKPTLNSGKNTNKLMVLTYGIHYGCDFTRSIY